MMKKKSHRDALVAGYDKVQRRNNAIAIIHRFLPNRSEIL